MEVNDLQILLAVGNLEYSEFRVLPHRVCMTQDYIRFK
jgi:hypothetical protein